MVLVCKFFISLSRNTWEKAFIKSCVKFWYNELDRLTCSVSAWCLSGLAQLFKLYRISLKTLFTQGETWESFILHSFLYFPPTIFALQLALISNTVIFYTLSEIYIRGHPFFCTFFLKRTNSGWKLSHPPTPSNGHSHMKICTPLHFFSWFPTGQSLGHNSPKYLQME